MSDLDYSKFTATKPKPSNDAISPHSHYKEPAPQGHSRDWGGAPIDAQKSAIDTLLSAAKDKGLNTHDTAYVLAIANHESGFNPHAAARSTSASGIGQFVDDTGKAYGLTESNRWDPQSQAKALVDHFVDNQKLAKTKGLGEDYIYKFHHDGPVKNYGGLDLSQEKVMPLIPGYEAALNQAAQKPPAANGLGTSAAPTNSPNPPSDYDYDFSTPPTSTPAQTGGGVSSTNDNGASNSLSGIIPSDGSLSGSLLTGFDTTGTATQTADPEAQFVADSQGANMDAPTMAGPITESLDPAPIPTLLTNDSLVA
jgi:putative chitinase